MQRIVNASRSLQILGELSSVYIPISNTPTKLPSYLAMQASSPWQVSALQAIALESMTLSSRLRSSTGGRGTLQDLEDTINSTGKRRIAKFEMSVADPDVLSEKPPNEVAPAEIPSRDRTAKAMNNYAALTSTLSREITESATDEGRKSTYSVEQKSFVETGISPTTARNEILTIDSTMDHHFKGMMPLFLNYLHYSILVLPTHVALHIWP
jgi:hypothetical protein